MQGASSNRMKTDVQEVPPGQEEEFLPSAVIEHWNRLSREYPSLETFQNYKDSILCSGMSLFKQGAGTR